MRGFVSFIFVPKRFRDFYKTDKNAPIENKIFHFILFSFFSVKYQCDITFTNNCMISIPLKEISMNVFNIKNEISMDVFNIKNEIALKNKPRKLQEI